MEKPLILLVEDKIIVRNNIKEILGEKYNFLEAGLKEKAISFLCNPNHKIDLILLDLYLPDSKGTRIVELISKQFDSIPIIVVTVEKDPHIAAEVIKKGATDYISKQKIFSEEQLFTNMVNNVIKTKRLRAGKKKESENYYFPENNHWHNAIMRMKIAVKESLPVLLTGESGVGKSMTVKYLHMMIMPHSPLVVVDCGVLPQNMIEAELFGYKRYAFTDAKEARTGKIEKANGGILFLDEITNASFEVQEKLLHVLQEKTITRLGENTSRPVSFSLITATNKNVRHEIEAERFREDLYFRIKAEEIYFRPLRESPEILDHYLKHFLNVYNRHFSTNFMPDMELYKDLLSREWKGNLRELDMTIKKMVCYHSYGIEIPRETIENNKQEEGKGLQGEMEVLEKNKIIQSLNKNKGNVKEAALHLGIPRTTLNNKIKKYNIDSKKYKLKQ